MRKKRKQGRENGSKEINAPRRRKIGLRASLPSAQDTPSVKKAATSTKLQSAASCAALCKETVRQVPEV